jgi:hypothetical protein
MSDLYVRRFDRQDPRLGRQVVHDPRSRAFPLATAVDTSTWRSKAIRIYDPAPNPSQVIGNCTGCAKAIQLNAAGNRKTGVVLRMADADRIYSLATSLDPWPGAYPPDDTGSSGGAAAKAAPQLGLGGTYRWVFNGADGVVQAVMDGLVVNVGTSWTYGMFDPDANGFIEPTGAVAGGHEYSARGYVEPLDAVIIRCWWGSFRDVLIKREHLNDLIMDDGDALVQQRA